ncbi:MAG: glycosyltransferase family 39 protein [Oscillospiraceae bacterium]|nr:glycosyltransferase family 39 protein [Oscillospiraceae bacterium]
MKFPAVILLGLSFAVLVFFFLFIPDLRTAHEPKLHEKNKAAKELLLCGIITLAYAAAAFTNLGSLSDPETFVSFETGNSTVLTLDRPAEIDRLLLYTGIDTGSYTVAFSEDGMTFYTAAKLEQDYAEILKWQEPELLCAPGTRAAFVLVSAEKGSPRLGEIAVFSGGMQIGLSPENPEDRSAVLLCDEQEKVPEDVSYLNSSYFDEVYHVRTALEHMEGKRPYEISHPPLGKLIISLGMLLFGTVPFGWRFMGALFGVLMLPAMYAFLKKIAGGLLVPACGTLLLASGFMHFTQTRIATIDTYAVFFIILMYYFLYRWICDEKNSDLSLSGLFFGLGAASKWTCIFAGAGLAVIWLVFRLYKLFGEGGPDRKKLKELALNCAWCILFFVLIPGLIYYLSYFPYGIANGLKVPEMFFTGEYAKIVADNQAFMLSYHEGVTATHPYSSRWYQWILDIRPILYYLKYYPGGRYSSIAAFVNPLICWGGLAAMMMLAVHALIRKDKTAAFIVCGWLAQLLPWIFVKRVVFEYHYFPSSVFLVLSLAYLFAFVRGKRHGKTVIIGFTSFAVLLFVLFYPVISGLPADRTAYSAWMSWLPTWPF